MKKITVGQLCKPNSEQIKPDFETLVDYIDIASVDNVNKRITGFTTYKFGEAPSRARKSVKNGSILVSTVRPNLNAVAVFDIKTNNIPVASTGFCVLDCKEDTYPRFLFNYLQSKAFVGEMVSQATGASYPAVSDKIVRSAHLPAYSYKEQVQIANLLDCVSNVIAKRKQQLKKLDELVKARFIEMFGDPETNPNRWSISKLSEFCDLQNGYAFKSDDYLTNSTVLNCRMSNIRPDGGFDAEYHPKYLPDTFWEKYKEYRLVDGDVIIAMTDMASDPKILGVPTIVRTNGKKFLLNQRVGKLTFYDNTTINNVYLMFVLSQKHIRQQLVKSAGGSTQINVGKPAVLAVEFFVPPMELQNQFATFVEQTDKSKLTIQQSLDKLETLKKALMQEYFG